MRIVLWEWGPGRAAEAREIAGPAEEGEAEVRAD